MTEKAISRSIKLVRRLKKSKCQVKQERDWRYPYCLELRKLQVELVQKGEFYYLFHSPEENRIVVIWTTII